MVTWNVATSYIRIMWLGAFVTFALVADFPGVRYVTARASFEPLPDFKVRVRGNYAVICL